MKVVKLSRQQIIGWALTMPVILYILCSIMYGQLLLTDWHIAAVAIPILAAIGYFSWFLHVQYTTFITNQFPSLQQTWQRAVLRLTVNLVVMTPTLLFTIYLFHYLHIMNYSIGQHDVRNSYLLGLSVNILFETLQEVIYLLNKYKETLAEEEMLKQMQLEQEFDNLREKINPHFLFNCFNTLLYLITNDKIKAEHFLDELSRVYRYLLRNNENDISTVEQEITFIQSYAGLLKTRFGEGFDLTINISEYIKTYYIPSLTLQLLVENALKHNVASAKKPIKIAIYSVEEKTLVIENTRSKKLSSVVSTGIGIASIKEKYRLLQSGTIHIQETDTLYKVSLPLLSEHALQM